jgi:hypothetical protein
MKIYRKSQKLSEEIKRISTKKIMNCQKSDDKSTNKIDEFEFSSNTFSLSFVNSRVKQKVFFAIFNFVCFKVFRNLATFARILKNSFFAIFKSNSSFSRIRFKLFHDASTHERSRRTHSANLKWFFIFTQIIKSIQQKRQTTTIDSSSFIMML